MDQHPWDLRDPEQTLRDIAVLCPFVIGSVVVAAVELTTQRVTGARVAAVGAAPEEPEDREVVRRLAEELVPERWASGPGGSGMTHVLITVVCRQGRVAFTAQEGAWLRAWRYANHFRAAFDGDVYVVTPHGWGGTLDPRAGDEPRTEASAAA